MQRFKGKNGVCNMDVRTFEKGYITFLSNKI